MLDLNFKKCVRAFSFLLLVTQASGAFAQNINRVRDYENEAFKRCNRMHNTFVFNKANVNVLVAMACTSRSHAENDRNVRVYDNSATMFHQWTTTSEGANEIHVEGFCAVPLGEMRRGELNSYKIDFSLSKVQRGSDTLLVPSGNIAGMRPTLEFHAPRSTDGFLDKNCPGGENRVNSLNIGMGLSPAAMLGNLMSIFKSGHGTSRLNLREVESWTQGNSSVGMSGVGMQYEMASMVDPRGSGGMTVSASTEVNLHIRSSYDSNIFDDNWFDLKTDDYGMPSDFVTSNGGNNSEFEAYSTVGGSSMVGCTSLVYNDPRSGKPTPADIQSCKDYIRRSPLAQYTAQEYISAEKEIMNKEDLERLANAKLIQKANEYLKASGAAPAKRYASGPNVFETGKARWSKEDVNRGYVVTDRSMVIDKANNKINVTEHRLSLSGQKTIKHYSIPLTNLNK